jgi:hypothetical protein
MQVSMTSIQSQLMYRAWFDSSATQITEQISTMYRNLGHTKCYSDEANFDSSRSNTTSYELQHEIYQNV